MGVVAAAHTRTRSVHREAHGAWAIAGTENNFPFADRAESAYRGCRRTAKWQPSYKEIIHFDDEDLTPEKIESKTRQTLPTDRQDREIL